MVEYEAPNPDFERAVKERISSMPVARFYGFRFGALRPGEAEIVQPYRDELSHSEGFFQGGVIGAVATSRPEPRPALSYPRAGPTRPPTTPSRSWRPAGAKACCPGPGREARTHAHRRRRRRPRRGGRA